MAKILCFDYGSYMSSARLHEFVPHAKFVANGYVEGHRLTFDKESEDGSGECDAEKTEATEHHVWGVVWEIDETEKPEFDRAEGLGKGYAEIEVSVHTGARKPIVATMYYATNKNPNLQPTRAYLKHVVDGAREHELPEEYCVLLERTVCREDTAADAPIAPEASPVPSAPMAPFLVTAAPTASTGAPAPVSMKSRYWETPANMWHLGRVPPAAEVNGASVPHPGRTCAVFVVHGVGRRVATATAAGLRSGFEDALDAIKEWQHDEKQRVSEADPHAKFPPDGAQIIDLEQIPPPFVFDGFWSDYQDGEATFKDEWAQFVPREKQFFTNLFGLRASAIGAFFWFLGQQCRLFWKVLGLGIFELWQGNNKVGLNHLKLALLIYLPLQVTGTAALVFALIRYQRIYRDFLLDVRMYIAPKGFAERAIVENIDRRVGKLFMQLIGLDLDFRPLPDWERIEAGGGTVSFDRVVWVAHSLGTVISYNVLARLFESARGLEKDGDAEQRRGVVRFRTALTRFVTMGSPLNKIAFLFPESLRPWPTDRPRKEFVLGGDRDPGETPEQSEWWINFYHVLDPVSGPIRNPLLCGPETPDNYHLHLWHRWWPKAALIMGFLLPGWAHVEYWADDRTLRYILGRTFGRKFLYDQDYHPLPDWAKDLMGIVALCFWALVIFVGGVGAFLQILVWCGVFSWKDVVTFSWHVATD